MTFHILTLLHIFYSFFTCNFNCNLAKCHFYTIDKPHCHVLYCNIIHFVFFKGGLQNHSFIVFFMCLVQSKFGTHLHLLTVNETPLTFRASFISCLSRKFEFGKKSSQKSK